MGQATRSRILSRITSRAKRTLFRRIRYSLLSHRAAAGKRPNHSALEQFLELLDAKDEPRDAEDGEENLRSVVDLLDGHF